MSKPEITHDNHYVPQFYLRNWSTDGLRVFTYRLLASHPNVPLWELTSIKKVGFWKDFYTRDTGGIESDEFEKWFNAQFETPAEPIFQKILKNRTLSQSEIRILGRYVAAQHLRTPARVDDILRIEHEILPKVIEKTHREIMSKPIPKAQATIDPIDRLMPMRVKVDRQQQIIETEVLVGKGLYLYAIKHLLSNTLSVMDAHQWTIIEAASGMTFPTSDDPVVCLNYYSENDYDFNGGWGLENGIILLPLSPRKLLFTQIGSSFDFSVINRSGYWTQFFRKIIIEHAHRYVFAEKPDEDIFQIRPRVISKEAFDQEKKTLAEWHSKHSKIENEFLSAVSADPAAFTPQDQM